MSHFADMLIRKELTPSHSKTVLVMVGLPARGKSFISWKLCCFYNWLGTQARAFNVGQHRRVAETVSQDASYFDPNNAECKKGRDTLAMEVLDELLHWLDSCRHAVAVFDATNTTVERRRMVMEHVAQHDRSIAVIFVESRCDDPALLEANIQQKLLRSPDYAGMPYDEARADFLARLTNYERVFEPLGDSEKNLSYIKLLNLSSHLIAHRLFGQVTTTLMPYLMALHLGKRPVWLIRMPKAKTPAAMVSLKATYGDDTMCETGQEFAKKLAAYAMSLPEMQNLNVFVCTHRRALDCAAFLDASGSRVGVHASLNPMDWGAYDGIRRADFKQETSPEFYEAFTHDPIGTRFPGGESYADFLRRLMPVVVEIEQQLDPVVVIAPLSVLQVLHCYFGNIPVTEAMEVPLSQHGIFEWRPEGNSFASRVVLESDLAV